MFVPVFALVSLAAILLLIYFYAQSGTPGVNEYGAVPAVWTPNRTPAMPAAPPPSAAN